VIGARLLLHAEAARNLTKTPSDVPAHEVLNNIDAMVLAVERVRTGVDITEELLLELHHRLLQRIRLDEYGGRFREEQNWIGGSDYNPCSATYVPPPPELVGDIIADLCAFCNDDSLPIIAQAAIAHAQFETIHPFVDGNGRTGRALIHMVFRRRGLAERVLLPVSLVLATMARSYIDGLTVYRHFGSPVSRQALDGLNTWVSRFAGAGMHSIHARCHNAEDQGC